MFLLTLTGDFGQNWKAVRDPVGSFITPSRVRCRVEPQPHHARHCVAVVVRHGEKCVEAVPYEAVVLAPIMTQLCFNAMGELLARPPPASR